MFAILREIDRHGRRSRDQFLWQIVGELERSLAAQRHDDSRWLFCFDDVVDILEGQRFEVEPVAGVVVGRNRLRVAVDHDRLIAGLGELEAGVDTAVIELDALTNTVRSRTEDHDLLTVRWAHFAVVFPCRVVIRRLRIELGTTGVDGLERRNHSGGYPSIGDLIERHVPQVGELCVGEAHLLRTLPAASTQLARRSFGQRNAFLGDAQHLIEEPWVDLGHLVQFFDRLTATQECFELENPLGCFDRRLREQFVEIHLVQRFLTGVTVQAESSQFEASQALLERFGEGSSNRHCFADRLHLGEEDAGRAGELLERPARQLGYDIVDRRLKTRRGLLGDVVRNFIEGVANGQTCRDLCDRESRRFRCERRRARHTWVHFDDDLTAGLRVDSELHVRSTGLYADAAHHCEGVVAHLLQLDVGQGLGRCHGDRIARVYAHRVDVLDRADDHLVVRVVTHDLELVFLPALDRLLDEDLVDWARIDAK